MQQQRQKLKVSDNDRPLDFWENGPIRQILDMEFEMALLRLIGEEGAAVDEAMEKTLHDRIVPEVFQYVTREIAWSEDEEQRRTFTVANQQLIQQEMHRSLSSALAQTAQSQMPAFDRVFAPVPALAFRWLPSAMRKFFSP